MSGRIGDNKQDFLKSSTSICTDFQIGIGGGFRKANLMHPGIIEPEEIPPWYEPGELRAFISYIGSRGELIVISKEVDPRYEIGGFLKKYEQQGKAVMFQKVKGANIPVVGVFTKTGKELVLF